LAVKLAVSGSGSLKKTVRNRRNFAAERSLTALPVTRKLITVRLETDPCGRKVYAQLKAHSKLCRLQQIVPMLHRRLLCEAGAVSEVVRLKWER
jgi:hypothetical protein